MPRIRNTRVTCVMRILAGCNSCNELRPELMHTIYTKLMGNTHVARALKVMRFMHGCFARGRAVMNNIRELYGDNDPCELHEFCMRKLCDIKWHVVHMGQSLLRVTRVVHEWQCVQCFTCT